MTRLFTKANMARLTKAEASMLMRLQMSRSYSSNDGYVPDDCSYCGACGDPILGSGWCDRCYGEYERLMAKARGEVVAR